MTEVIKAIGKLHCKTVELSKLTRGIAKDTIELVRNTLPVTLNRIIRGVATEKVR